MSAWRILRQLLSGAMLLLWLGAACAGERGLLWKIEPSQGPASYLFGTIHIDDPRVNDFSPRLRGALAAADRLMLESLPPSDSRVLMLPAGTLRDLLPQEDIAEVLRQADAQAMRDEVALRMKPWLLAVLLSRPSGGMLSQDLQLMGLANDGGKPVLGLEDAQQHFGALDALTQEEQLSLLRAVLRQTAQQREQDLEALVQAYLTRDSEAIARLDAQLSSSGLPPGLWQKMQLVLLDERNVRMAESLVRQMRQASVFAAVGAAHLPGEGGLLARLRAAGFRLTPLE